MEADDQAFHPNAPASTEALASLRTVLAKSPPESYFAFLTRANGGDWIRGSICWLADRRKGNRQFVRFISGDLRLGSMREVAWFRQLPDKILTPSLLNSPQLRFVCEDERSGV